MKKAIRSTLLAAALGLGLQVAAQAQAGGASGDLRKVLSGTTEGRAILADLCQGSVVDTLWRYCTRRDTVLTILEVTVFVDSVEVETEIPGDQSGFLPPPVDGWRDELYFGLRPGLYALTLRDSLGQEALWDTLSTSPAGGLVFQRPPAPWDRRVEWFAEGGPR